ncbi:RDD family protein [Rhodococcus sp. D2-41]|nr:RDD family protein [Rhodococcus sp. D2-41]
MPSPPPELRSIESFGRLDAQPRRFGERADLRYPSPKTLRWIASSAVDFVLHAVPMLAVFAAVAYDPTLAKTFPLLQVWALVSWPALSMLNRIVIQAIFHATVGKALFGLVVIRPEDGRWPSFGRLTKAWFLYLLVLLILAACILGDAAGDGGPSSDFTLSTVRRTDAMARSEQVTNPRPSGTRRTDAMP